MKDFFYHIFIHPFSGPFSQLLLSLSLLFVFRPYEYGPVYRAIWQVFFILVFLTATFNCDHPRPIKIVISCLAVPALICDWIFLFTRKNELLIPFLICTIVFIVITASSIIKQVVLNARVTLETLRGVVCAYLMFAFGFAFLYVLINIFIPESFFFGQVDIKHMSPSRFLSEMIYFSFVTILTIGYGDIVAIKDLAQTFVILEGTVGQFYIAILVARLVGVYSIFAAKVNGTLPEKTQMEKKK